MNNCQLFVINYPFSVEKRDMDRVDIKTLIEMLAYRAQETAVSTAYTYQNEPKIYAEMWLSINRVATYLLQLGLARHDRVVMALPNGHDFFAAFYGAQRAGGIAVPVFPGYSAGRILQMVQLCGAKIVVLPSETPAEQLNLLREQTAPLGLTLITVTEADGMAVEASFPEIDPDDIAFLQYTSGSTGNPKGVQLTHRNLITNVNQMIAGMEITPEEIFVSWLPVYHDMGLILKTMVPFYLGAQTHLLPTGLGKIHHWVEAIQGHQATFTAAPDFAYRLLVRRISKPEDYDLSTLRVALNAAEPVRVSTMQDFEAAFGLRKVMVAGYGLAEATVGVSMWPPNHTAKVDDRGFVAVGRPFPEVAITILREGQPVPAGEIGEIAITSTANTSGYFNNAQATEALYWSHDGAGENFSTQRRRGAEGFEERFARWRAANPFSGELMTFLSGDLGYLDQEGYLYVVGRKKNMIIQAGETIYAAEVEEVVNDVTAVRYSAAVGIDQARIEGEQVVIFAETRGDENTPQAQFQETIIDIVQAFQERFGFRPGDVYLLKPKTIPMTYNGKLQHIKLKQQFLDGDLRENGRILYPDY